MSSSVARKKNWVGNPMHVMKWRKAGHVLSLCTHRTHWRWSHAQNPSPIVLGDRIRVFFNTRPKPSGRLRVSYPAYVDLDLQNPSKILGFSPQPVLALGEVGGFDQHGCMTGCVIQNGDELWMYYVGWSRSVGVPYNWAIGLAASQDGGFSFQRMFRGPIIGSQFNEPYLQNGQTVLRLNEREWHMWYSTGMEWISSGDKFESRYIITHATSVDGIHWQRTGEPLLPFVIEQETQTTPTIFHAQGRYHLYFSYRHSTAFRNAERGYKIGYAWSEDLKTWHREDALAGICVSAAGWDSEMVCYPAVCAVGKRRYLFYCGNGFGEDGFGFATLVS